MNITARLTPTDDLLARIRAGLTEPLPQPSASELASYAHEVLAWAVHHFTSRADQPLGESPPLAELRNVFRDPLPDLGCDFESVLNDFIRNVVPNNYRVDHPKFLAFIPSAPTFFAILGDWLATALNSFNGVWLEGAGSAAVELAVLDWFKDILNYPKFSRGSLTSGGSEANLTALVTAREATDPADRDGLILYVSEQRHRSIDRAARVMGLTPEQVQAVPADEHFRLPVAVLRDTIRRDRAAGKRPWAVVANAGATNTGTVDPLRELAALCHTENIWLHADAAYGWPALLTDEGREALAGLNLADSITLDPHKWFAQPFESGCVLIRDGQRLSEAFRQRPDYLQDALHDHDEFNFADHGLALTRRSRALKLWFSVRTHGLSWFREMVEHTTRLAEYAAGVLVQSSAFELACPRQLSIVCFRHVVPGQTLPDDVLDRLNLALVERLRLSGRGLISSTRLRGRVVLRMCFINWRTTADDVDEIIAALTEIAGQLDAAATPHRPQREER